MKFIKQIFPILFLALLIISACHKTHNATIEPGPVNFSLKRLTPTAIRLSWADGSNKVAGYTIERQTNFNKFEVIGTVGASIFSFADTALLLSHVYNYRVCAYDAAGTQSAFSDVLTFSTYFTPQADTTYIVSPVPVATTHNVFVEAFFGQSDATAYTRDSMLYSFQQLHPGRINILSLFQNNGWTATTPPAGAAYDLRSDIAVQLDNTIYNGGSGIPGAGFDRANYLGSFTPLVTTDEWVPALNSRLSVPNPVNLSVNSLYAAGIATITATITYTQEVSTAQNLSIFIVEDSIIDLHLMPLGVVDTAYVYNNVLRAKVTPNIMGDRMLDSLAFKEPGRVLRKQYIFVLPSTVPAINPAHCRVISLVNSPGLFNGSTVDFQVFQSEQTKFAP